MNERTRLLIATILAVGATVAGAAAPPVLADVAVDLAPNGGGQHVAIVSIVSIIVDDPDPLGWASVRPSAPTRFLLNPDGQANGDGRPSVVVDRADGAPIVVWAKSGPGGFDVVYSRFDVAGGASGAGWSQPVVVVDLPVDALDPVLVQDPADDAFHLLYATGGTSPAIWHRAAPQDLSSWSAPLQVSLPSEYAARPGAVFHDGDLHVVYETHADAAGGGPHQVVLARDLSGDVSGLFDYRTMATTPYTGAQRPSVHSFGGRLWVRWIDDAQNVCWDRLLPGGGWEGTRQEPYADAEDRDFAAPVRVRQAAIE